MSWEVLGSDEKLGAPEVAVQVVAVVLFLVVETVSTEFERFIVLLDLLIHFLSPALSKSVTTALSSLACLASRAVLSLWV